MLYIMFKPRMYTTSAPDDFIQVTAAGQSFQKCNTMHSWTNKFIALINMPLCMTLCCFYMFNFLIRTSVATNDYFNYWLMQLFLSTNRLNFMIHTICKMKILTYE